MREEDSKQVLKLYSHGYGLSKGDHIKVVRKDENRSLLRYRPPQYSDRTDQSLRLIRGDMLQYTSLLAESYALEYSLSDFSIPRRTDDFESFLRELRSELLPQCTILSHLRLCECSKGFSHRDIMKNLVIHR